MLYNTEIAIKSLGVKLPETTPSLVETTCACCSRHISVGDPYHLGIIRPVSPCCTGVYTAPALGLVEIF